MAILRVYYSNKSNGSREHSNCGIASRKMKYEAYPIPCPNASPFPFHLVLDNFYIYVRLMENTREDNSASFPRRTRVYGRNLKNAIRSSKRRDLDK